MQKLMHRLEYPERFKKDVMDLFKGHDLVKKYLDDGELIVGDLLKARDVDYIPLDTIIRATDLQSLKELANERIEAKRLYSEWLHIYNSRELTRNRTFLHHLGMWPSGCIPLFYMLKNLIVSRFFDIINVEKMWIIKINRSIEHV